MCKKIYFFLLSLLVIKIYIYSIYSYKKTENLYNVAGHCTNEFNRKSLFYDIHKNQLIFYFWTSRLIIKVTIVIYSLFICDVLMYICDIYMYICDIHWHIHITFRNVKCRNSTAIIYTYFYSYQIFICTKYLQVWYITLEGTLSNIIETLQNHIIKQAPSQLISNKFFPKCTNKHTNKINSN